MFIGDYMKKVFLITILILSLFLFYGCKDKNKEKVYPTYIEDSEIFSMPEDHYYIFFEKDGCSKCEAVLPTIIDYLTYYEDGNKYPKLYAVNVAKNIDGEVKKSIISRIFTYSNTGQGIDGDFYVDGTTDYLQLFISSTPSIIEIYTKDNQKVAKFIADGKTNINNYFSELEKDK